MKAKPLFSSAAVAMSSAGGGDEMGGGGGRPALRGAGRSAAAGAAARQDLGAGSGSRKRKAAVMSRDLGSLAGNAEYMEVACEDSQKLLKEIEDLRSQLDDDVKELGYCEENEKLRIELALKAEEIKCIRKQNEDMQAKYDGMAKLNRELQAKNGSLIKQNEKLNRELQANDDGFRKRIEKLEAKNAGQRKQSEELQAKNDSLTKQNEELQAKNYSLMKKNDELQAKNDSTRKWNKELQAKNDDLHKNGLKDRLTGCIDTGTKISCDIIPESVQRLEQAEPTLCQAASSFEEIGHLQAPVNELDTAVNQLVANNCAPAEIKAVLEDPFALSDDEDSGTDNNLLAHLAKEVSNTSSEDSDLDTRICELMVTTRKSKPASKKFQRAQKSL